MDGWIDGMIAKLALIVTHLFVESCNHRLRRLGLCQLRAHQFADMSNEKRGRQGQIKASWSNHRCRGPRESYWHTLSGMMVREQMQGESEDGRQWPGWSDIIQ